jgi:hypothetical protein
MQMISQDTENPRVRLIICETHSKLFLFVSRVIKCHCCNENVIMQLYSRDITKTINDLPLITDHLSTENNCLDYYSLLTIYQ